jgi:hypothetical protein
LSILSIVTVKFVFKVFPLREMPKAMGVLGVDILVILAL